MNTEKDFGTFDNSFQKKKKYIKLKPATFFSIIGLLIILLGVSFFLYTRKNTNVIQQQPENALSEEEVAALTQSISNLMIIPREEPVVFVVSDVQELVKQQPFFKDAINGDVLFIFPEAAKAVIYSPSRNIIVNTGPVTADNSQVSNQGQVQETPSQPVEVQENPVAEVVE